MVHCVFGTFMHETPRFCVTYLSI